MIKLFGNRIEPACKYCENAFGQLSSNVLCIRHGPVSPDHSCHKYRYDPTKRAPLRKMPQEVYSSEDFSL